MRGGIYHPSTCATGCFTPELSPEAAMDDGFATVTWFCLFPQKMVGSLK
jgi:hypothetical protein